MWKILSLFMYVFYINYAEATYNTGIKTRVYEQQPLTHVYHHHHQHQQQQQHQPYTPIYEHSNQYSDNNNDRGYQTSITHHYINTDNSQQHTQHEGDYYQPSPTTTTDQLHRREFTQEHHHQQPNKMQPQQQPVYERQENSRTQTTANWQNAENSVNDYYTGCPTGHTGQLPYAYDCRRFLNCWHGRGHIQTCSVGTVFNPETLECDRPDKVKCETALGMLGVQSVGNTPPLNKPNYKAGRYTDVIDSNVEVLCPAGAVGLQPHPSDCTRFLNCANGNMHIQQCGPGTAYSISMKVCDFKHKVDCSGREAGDEVASPRQDTQAAPPTTHHVGNTQHQDLPHSADILCLNGITGLFPYPFDYTKFINCKNGNTAIQNCVPGTAFSISKGYCESLDVAVKSDHVMYIVSEVSYEYSQTLITCPPGTEGLHLYPFNAELFVKCIKSQLKIIPCDNAKVFSVSRRTCLPFTQVLKHERVRLLSELEPASNYRVTDDHYSIKNMVYCPGGLMGTYPHPFDSTKYLKCVRGRLMSESCASGQAFSLSDKTCSLKEEISVDDYVPQTKSTHGEEWRISNIEITHGSIDGLTYLMCPPGVEGYFLHPFDCTKYIECTQGATAVDSCLNGAVYSISRKECIPRDKVKAYDRVEYMITAKNEFTNESTGQYHHDLGISCNPGTFGIYPHPHDCHKYIRCANGRIWVENCAAGQVFSITRSFCHNENEVDSKDRSSYNRGFNVNPKHHNEAPTNSGSATITQSPSNPQLSDEVLRTLPLANTGIIRNIDCPLGATGRYPHPLDCTKFVTCTNGKAHVQECGPGTAWNKEMEVCDFKEKVDCMQSGSTSTSVINSKPKYNCPVGVDGLYQHPYDWHKYLVCNRGQATVMSCAPGTVFSLSRKICDIEANVLNTDRCNNGVYSSDYDYTKNQDYNNKPYDTSVVNTQWSSTDTTQTQPATQITENRWTNMNIPRPQGSTGNVPNIDYPTPVWSGTAVHVDQHNPTHTVIYEEGSFEPNRNYNRPNTPLAPLKPTTTSTIVYAQPVGSQEESEEIFSNIPTKPINTFSPQNIPISNRQNHTRHLDTWTPIRPVDIPKHDLMPSYQDQNTVYTNTRLQIPITSHILPPYQSPQPSTQHHSNLPSGRPLNLPETHLMPPYGDEDGGQKPLAESDFKITTINIDQLPGHVSYNLNDLDQLPSSSTTHNTYHGPNFYGGLNSPPTDSLTTSTPHSFLYPYEQTTQIPPPTTATHRILGYPQLSNATIQTFPHQPHYSPPYSGVAHSRNATWVGRKVPQYSAIKPTNTDPSNSANTYIKITSTTSSQNYGSNPPPYSNSEWEGDTPTSEDEEAAMKAALKLLLKPYLDSNGKTGDDVAESAQSHIMNIVSNSDKDTSSTTTHQPILLNQNTLVPSTTLHQDDVEHILAGEQHSLVGVATKTGFHETSSSHNLYQTPLQPEPSPYTHNHNSNWHKDHHHNRHQSKLQHSREFHKNHPNLPNPFEDPINSYHSRAEATTPRTYDIDIRSGDRCDFECGNGKCVEQHQVCDGVNNCGNRKDEYKCEHLGYELRLTGGKSSNMGRVEVKILGKWGYVCDDKFGLHDADVVCRELGFKMGAMEVRGNSYYAPSDVNVNFVMDEVQCSGNETSLKECEFKGWGVNNCGPDEVVGVVCKVPKLKCPDNYWLCTTSKECIPTAFLCDVTPDCEDGSDESEEVCNAPIQYRLEGGRSSNEGRLEVFYRGEWGTVCDDDFGLKEAQVFCNSFGLYGKPTIVKNIYGPGSGPIWLDQISCLGNETRIDECNHWSWGENNCNHTEDVGIKCTAGPKPNPPKPNKSKTDDSSAQDKDLESTLQIEQSELDDLGLYQGLWQRSSKAIHSQKKCGHFKPNLFDEYEHPEERVVNGTIAKRGRHPWQATIRTRGRGGISSHWCGAVIISRKLILTAAHCLAGYPKGSYFVRMGDHYANIAESSEIDSNIENWYIHEKFRDEKHMNNDIALILLKTPLRFNDYVQPICLPEKGTDLEANRLCTISGWGSIKSGTSSPSNILRSAQVPILSNQVCSQKNVYANAMTEGMFCAGFLDESADACDGDSGGPLVCSDDDGETLYGIISWGQHCGYANHPGVYVRVEKYIDWIYDKINLMMQQGKL